MSYRSLSLLNFTSTIISYSDLEAVAKYVLDPTEFAESFRPSPGVPLKPMLSAVPEFEKVLDDIKSSPLVVQDKFDGERILVHIKVCVC